MFVHIKIDRFGIYLNFNFFLKYKKRIPGRLSPGILSVVKV